MERLWAGWRSAYVSSGDGAAGVPVAGAEGGQGCVFCRIVASPEPDLDKHVLWRHPGAGVVAILNAFPYTTGHLMVLPERHVADLEDLRPAELAAVMEGAAAGCRALKAAYGPDGINLGANLGAAAGAGVPGHLHLHVLPRWVGDTNFMTSVAEVRVLPEALAATAGRLRDAWPR
ncbi:MAG: HIT family protein [Acidimicrobiales bacterium]